MALFHNEDKCFVSFCNSKVLENNIYQNSTLKKNSIPSQAFKNYEVQELHLPL